MANTVEKGLVSKSALTAIGNAIRAKNGSTTKYKPSEMAAAISNLKGGDFTVATSDKFNFRVVQSANQTINSTPTGKTVSNSDGTVSLTLTDTTTISPNTNYVPGTIQRSYDDSTHTYTVTATNAEPIDGLVQNGWSIVYQKNPSDRYFYPNADYTGAINQNNLQGNILVGGMQSYSSSSTSTYPNNVNKILKFKNTFITSAGSYFLNGCSSLTDVELPDLTEVDRDCLRGTAITSAELPNLTTAGDNLLNDCTNIRSAELPKLRNLGRHGLFTNTSTSSPAYFIDCGYATNINPTVFRYTRVIVLRVHTIQTNFEQSQLSDPVLYIVPSDLLEIYMSKIRRIDYVTVLENSPFADGKTVCGNNMKTVYNNDVGTNDRVFPGEGTTLCYKNNVDKWEYVPEALTQQGDVQLAFDPSGPMYPTGFYFLSKLTKEQGYTIPQSLVPSGGGTVSPNGYEFTVPDRVKVIKVDALNTNTPSSYVGVTPGSMHYLQPIGSWLLCSGHYSRLPDGIHWMDAPNNTNPTYYLSWSPTINAKTPTVTDYNM